MKRKDVKNIGDIMECSVEEHVELGKTGEIMSEMVNLNIKLTKQQAIVFRDVMQVNSLARNKDVEFINNMFLAGLVEYHRIMLKAFSDGFDRKYPSKKSSTISSEKDLEEIVDALKANGKHDIAEFVKNKFNRKD